MYKKPEKIKTPTSRNSDVASLKDCIDDLINVYKLRGRLSEAEITGNWEKIMGKTISSRTEEIYFKDKKLFIKINSAPLKNELSFSKHKIIEKINEAVKSDAVSEIIFL
ncbi:DUF721 domain-containing protein [Sporocytophaga myxococcoides]|uniref:DUF721 domain-containing protein n=1 Tax=Sporocytophaga myxococcoides TaxID=153721 RepID=UPI00041FCC3A|nr:DUF721 domain-containing protein [Sporocytophaga myxococcoides]